MLKCIAELGYQSLKIKKSKYYSILNIDSVYPCGCDVKSIQTGKMASKHTSAMENIWHTVNKVDIMVDIITIRWGY